MIYYNLGFILIVPAIGFISCDSILLTGVTAQISEGGNITKNTSGQSGCIDTNSFARLKYFIWRWNQKWEHP